MSASIRPARLADLARVREIAERAYAPYVSRIGQEPMPMRADFAGHLDRGELFALAFGDDVAGYAVLYPRGDHIHLENVAIDPDRHGQGLGRILLEFAEETALCAGLSAVELYTNAKMTENLSLYPRLGYLETERRSEHGFSRVYYRKALG